MPTYDRTARFDREYAALTSAQRHAFRLALGRFVEDLAAGRRFRQGLRVRGVQRTPGVFEIAWARDGRATFEYGEPLREGHAHIVWRRIGTHAVLDEA